MDPSQRDPVLLRAPGDEYDWETDRKGSVRSGAAAARYVAVMFRRMALLDADRAALEGDPVLHKHLLSYGMEVHCNIAWYARRMRWEQRKRILLLAAIAILALFGISAIPFVWRFGQPARSDWNLIFFQLTAFPAAAFGVLRVLSTLADSRCRLGLFWRARADLAEILYLFEFKWQDRFSMGRLTEFQADVDAGIASARQIAREERQKFFDSLVSPGDLISVLQQLVEGFSGRFQSAPRAFSRLRAPEPPEVAPPAPRPDGG
jgi:hypothetical protein